jgi:hypothetical protein
MSKKAQADQNAQEDREVRQQGEKDATEVQSGGRGHQPTLAEKGGEHAVEQARERRAGETEDGPQEYDEHNNPIDHNRTQAEKEMEDARRLQLRDHDPGMPQDLQEKVANPSGAQGPVGYATSTGAVQPQTIHPDGSRQTKS